MNGTYKLPYITNMYGISATDDSLEDGNNYNSMYTMSVGDEFNIIIKNINVTVGTVLFSTSTSLTFFQACFGGTWVIDGNVDAIINDGESTVKLYMFRKTAM